jgi:hypothetical protein
MLLARANVPLAGVVLLGTDGQGNRTSLSEPVSWSRGRKPQARVAAPVAPHAVYPVASAPPQGAVPQQVQWPTEMYSDGYPTSQPSPWRTEAADGYAPPVAPEPVHRPSRPMPVIRLIDSSRPTAAPRETFNGHSSDSGETR